MSFVFSETVSFVPSKIILNNAKSRIQDPYIVHGLVGKAGGIGTEIKQEAARPCQSAGFPIRRSRVRRLYRPLGKTSVAMVKVPFRFV